MRVTGCVFVLRWVTPSVELRVRPEAPAVLGFGLDVGRDEGFGGGEDSRVRPWLSPRTRRDSHVAGVCSASTRARAVAWRQRLARPLAP